MTSQTYPNQPLFPNPALSTSGSPFSQTPTSELANNLGGLGMTASPVSDYANLASNNPHLQTALQNLSNFASSPSSSSSSSQLPQLQNTSSQQQFQQLQQARLLQLNQLQQLAQFQQLQAAANGQATPNTSHHPTLFPPNAGSSSMHKSKTSATSSSARPSSSSKKEGGGNRSSSGNGSGDKSRRASDSLTASQSSVTLLRNQLRQQSYNPQLSSLHQTSYNDFAAGSVASTPLVNAAGGGGGDGGGASITTTGSSAIATPPSRSGSTRPKAPVRMSLEEQLRAAGMLNEPLPSFGNNMYNPYLYGFGGMGVGMGGIGGGSGVSAGSNGSSNGGGGFDFASSTAPFMSVDGTGPPATTVATGAQNGSAGGGIDFGSQLLSGLGGGGHRSTDGGFGTADGGWV